MTSWYEINERCIEDNVHALFDAMRDANFAPAYSVKTNRNPYIVRKFYEFGFMADVVSDIEVGIAMYCGVPFEDMIYNGPWKGSFAHTVANHGGIIVFDSIDDMDNFNDPCKCMLRCAVDIDNGFKTRFGIRPEDVPFAFEKAVAEGYEVIGIHCHITNGRSADKWCEKIDGMYSIFSQLDWRVDCPIIDMGGNMFSPLGEEMRGNFEGYATYQDYGNMFADEMKRFGNVKLCLETGTAVIANAVSFYAEVLSVKETSGGTAVLLDCNHFNLGWASQKMNHAIKFVGSKGTQNEKLYVEDARFVGRLCTEDDVFHSGYTGYVSVGDMICFQDVGAYAIDTTPSFISPKPAILLMRSDGVLTQICREETLQDVISRYQGD